MDLLYLDEFKRYLEIHRHCRSNTVLRKIQSTRYVLHGLSSFDKKSVEDFLFKLKDQGKSSSHIENLIVTVRVYAQFLHYTHRSHDKYLIKYPFNKSEESYKGILTDEEIEKIISYPRQGNENKFNHKMYNLFFCILAYTGIRPGELSKCTPNHIDWGRMIFTLESGMVKTKKMRNVPIPSPCVEDIKWLIEDLKSNDYIFRHRQSGKKVRDSDWFYEFDKRIRFFSIKRRGITTYSLRHTFCTRLLEEDVNLFKIMKNMGHANPKTTMIYSHLTTKDLHDTVTKLPVIKSKLDPKETLISIKDFINKLKLDHRFALTIEDNPTSLMIHVRLV